MGGVGYGAFSGQRATLTPSGIAWCCVTISPRLLASLICGSSGKIHVPGATMLPFRRRIVSKIRFQAGERDAGVIRRVRRTPSPSANPRR